MCSFPDPVASAAPRQARPPRRAPVAMVRYPSERVPIDYREPYAREKAVLLARINKERAAAGRAPVRYDLLAAKVGDDFCVDSAELRFTGHWDTLGRAPYLRWALAGGVDTHAENFASHSRYGAPHREPAESLLMEAHEGFMRERPPDDGHRRTVLDPSWTHVGIGIALIGGEFRMTEEYSRRLATWIEIPGAPVAAGSVARFSASFPRDVRVGLVEIAYEEPPRPITPREIFRRGSYAYPLAVHTLRPLLGPGMTWEGGDRGDFPVTGGRIDIHVPLDHGRGNYYVIAYVGTSETGKKLTPATAALIQGE